MAVIYSVGLAKLELGDVSTTDGIISNWVEYPVYKDTAKIEEVAPTETKYYQAGKPHPVKVGLQGGGDKITLSIMDVSPATLAALQGGTVTTTNGVATWSKAAGQMKEKIKAVRATTLDGFVYVINRGSLRANRNFNLAENSIALLDIVVEATDTGFPAIAPATWTAPAA